MVWINRSETSDAPVIPTALRGRQVVWNTCRGNHLGQRPCADAPKGRTYGRKRLERISTAMNQQGFPRALFSDSESMLAEEASMDGPAFVYGFALAACGGD